MNQFIVRSVKFKKHINLWETTLDNGVVFYSRYQPIYQKGDVIKKVYNDTTRYFRKRSQRIL